MENKVTPPTAGERRIIKFMILLGIFSILYFLFYFFQPEHIGNPFLYIILSVTILYSVLKKLYMWYNYSNISVPETPEKTREYKVDILTTYYPGEPYQMTITTLEAINQITYPHTTYLCDEANDPYLKKFCEENGIIHVTRDNRINAKAGNINNALHKYATGEICVVLDPDHIPEPNFLDPILPHFENPEIGFVQIVQSYYNIKETLVARGAAEQTFQFYGPMMMTLNSYGAVNAIGANCVFRRSALDSIGGHAPGLCEDMHTAMLLYSQGWKAVYLPEVLARGLAPSNLTNFFKQQLKWSRGTFDLLVKVYPKIFSKLTGRQKIHYGILPLHYFGGVICFINFLIPILSLLFSVTPWRGNIIDFALVLIPVIASSLLIRTFIQKWVIEKKERGFHLVGGLLHINTWWVYMLGLFFTIIDKRIPYLPTPKEDEWNTNIKLIIPNAAIAFLSILAIVIGLNRDLTPFSVIMAGFAFFNACIMFFGIYLTFRVTNHNRILRNSLSKKPLSLLWKLKHNFYRLANFAFATTRLLALPLLLGLLIASMSFKQQKELSRWENVETQDFQKRNSRYLGIYHPTRVSGLSDIQEINLIENVRNVDFDIISYYLAWNRESVEEFPHHLMESIYEKDAIPMITWEPWVSVLPESDSIPALAEGKEGLKYIAEGYFDDYIKEFVQILKTYNKPVFLRFAHEFDNPHYPWSGKGNNTPEDFIAAWQHLSDLLKEEDAHQVMMVWNPWKPEVMERYYPGDKYVDWIGLTVLNYGALAGENGYYSFQSLYHPFREKLVQFTDKPVMLAEFGSVKLGNRQNEWFDDAIKALDSDYQEVKAVILFNSLFDKNIPTNDWYNDSYINWTINSFGKISKAIQGNKTKINFSSQTPAVKSFVANPVTNHEIKGVRYKKGTSWRNNYYAVSRNVLLEDFKKMTEAGINTIHITGGNIYDHNIISYSNDYDLNVIYQFQTENEKGFIRETEDLQEMKSEILEKVQELKDNNNVIGYSFSYDLENYFLKPLLFSQREAYLKWLNSVITEIKKIDPSKSIVMDLDQNAETDYHIRKINQSLPVDSYGLIIQNDTDVEKVLNTAKEEGLSVFISSVNPNIIDKDLSRFDMDIVLQNWQDERRSNWLTFDGLLNFNGDKRDVYREIKNAWGREKVEGLEYEIEILKPAVPLYPGSSYTFEAMVLHENQWKHAEEADLGLDFEWYLIRQDEYDNPLAIKETGQGPEAEVEIPEEFQQFKLLLVAKDEKGYVKSFQSFLHTPLEYRN